METQAMQTTQRTGLEALSIWEPLRAEENAVAVYLASLGSANSKRAMLAALQRIVRLIEPKGGDVRRFPWAQLRPQHMAVIRAELGHVPAGSANLSLAALRGVLKAAWRLGQISSDDYARAVDIKGFRGEPTPAGRALSHRELKALFEVCQDDQTAAGCRDAAMLAVMYVTGLRRSELVALDLTDYEPESGALTVHCGKGNKHRVVYVTNGSVEYLQRWLTVRGDEAGALFHPVRKGGEIQRRRLTDQTIAHMLIKRSEEAGISAVQPHDLRRSFVSDLLDAGADVSAVQKLAGHANVQTTIRYDRRGEQAKMRAAGMLHVPLPPAPEPVKVKPESLKAIYTTGYAGKRPEELKAKLDELDAVLCDVRISPKSRQPGWNGQELKRLLGERYVHVRELGNKNFKGGPVELVDLKAGTARVLDLAASRPVVLMCVCRELAGCHRNDVRAELQRHGIEASELV